MAQSVTKVTNLKSNIQSKAQEAVTSMQQKTASSTKATQEWSTITPEVTETPKVADMQKAEPSITQWLTPVSQWTINISSTPDVTDLLWAKTISLKKAETEPNLLWEGTQVDTPKDVSSLVGMYDSLPDAVKWAVWDAIKENGLNIFKTIFNVAVQETPVVKEINNLFESASIDAWRTIISTVQWYLNKAYFNNKVLPDNLILRTTIPWYDILNTALSNTNYWKTIKEQRDNVFEAIFDKTEELDQRLAHRYWYKEAKKTADKWSEQWKWIMDAIDEWNWDVVATRVWETFWQMIPTLIAVMATKDPKVWATMIFGNVFWDSYKRSIVEINNNPEFDNLTPSQKDDLATLMAMAEAWIEAAWDVLELAPFMKWKNFSIANMLWLKNVILSTVANLEWWAIIEWWEEVLTEILQNVFKRAYGWSDSATAKELWDLFMDTFLIMQFVWLLWGAKWWIETHRRNTAVNLLSHEAEKYEDFNEFEATAERWGITDKELITEAWAKAKWLSTEQGIILNTDLESVQRQEAETTKLYEEKDSIETELTALRENAEENKSQIEKYETRLQEIDNRLQEIEKNIKEYMELYWEEELPAQKEIQLPREEWWQNLSEQTMVRLTEEWWFDKEAAKQSFEKSINQIIQEWKDYNETDFANYAYYNTATNVVNTNERMQMVNKVEDLLGKMWINVIYTATPDEDLWEWVRWLYESKEKRVTYAKDENDIPIYWHEVFHAVMDIIKNWDITDKNLKKEMRTILRKAINEVKKQFGIDWYKIWTEEYKWANIYAEEWLANSFWEYLAGREIAWPKSFVQKIKDFFHKIINLFSEEWRAENELRRAFDAIVDGKIVKAEWEFGATSLIGRAWRVNPIEASTDITQDAMRDINEEAYDNLVKENQLQTEQQQELWEHYEDIIEAWKESENDNKIEEVSHEANTIEDVQWIQTTAQTIKDAFWKDEKKQKKAFSLMKTEAWQAFRDMFSPAISRIYNISPRVAWRLVQMEWHREIYVARYRERAKPFVEAVSKLDKNAKIEIKKALLDYWALASEQWENIEQYKKDEVAKLKETLNKYGITNEMLDDVIWVLNDLWNKYKDAWLSITLTDMYFPRTVTDYEWLSQYIADRTWVEWKERENLLNRISKIRRNEELTEEEKEKSIRRLLTVDYHEPWTTSKYWKERKLWKLSDWWEWIYQFYADPMESLDSYIVNMENAIQRQLFLWWLQEEAWLKWENVSFTEIVEWLVDQWQISNEDLEELKKTVLSVLNKKPSPKVVRTLKDATYIMTLTNFLSAINQLDDLWMAIIKNKNWLKHVVKAIFNKAGIKYTDLWLEDSYEMFRWQWKITNWMFKKSLFSTFDRLGKESFVNAAWDSLIAQAKKNKDWTDSRSRINLKKRLEDMYWTETMEHMMDKIDSGNYMTNWQIDIDILLDLLYQLWNTQPIFTSAMPTVYLDNPWIRLCYALQSFTIKRIDMLVQWTKQVYKNNWWWAWWAVVAWSWLMWVSAFLAMFWVAIWDTQDWLKDEEEETVLWKLMNEWIDEALKEVWNEWKSSWLKIWNLSLYDKKTYNREWMWWLLMSKVKPPMIWIWKNFVDAITEHNADEITDLVQYVPLIWKLLYYRYFDDIAEATGKSESWLIRRKDEWLIRREWEDWLVRRKDEWLIRRK